MRVELVRVAGVMRVAVIRDGGGVEPRVAWELAASLGAQRLALVLPPRREDCELRVRTFTSTRELPRSVESALAVAALYGRALTMEEGVTATRVIAAGEEGAWRVETPPVVVGTQDLDDPGRAAQALGLGAKDLHGARPVRAVSCGPNVLVIPLEEVSSLLAAELDLGRWQAVVGKARHDAAVAVVPLRGHCDVAVRCFSSDPARGEDPVNGLAAAALAGYLTQFTRAITTVNAAFIGSQREAEVECVAEGRGWWVSAQVEVEN